MDSKDKPFILFILPGPIFYPESQLRVQLELLSNHYRGVVFSTSSSPEPRQFGSFKIELLPFHSSWKVLSHFRLLLHCLKLAFTAKLSKDSIKLIVSYDPLATGVISWITSLASGAKRVVQVNGVYQSAHLYNYQKSRWAGIKVAIFPRIAKFVLNRAHGIKLLFPNQIDDLNINLVDKVVQSYFDFVDIERFYEGASEKCVLFIGHPLHVKGVDILLKAFIEAQKNCPDWRLKILGWFPGDEDKYIRSFTNKYPYIEYHPPVPHEDIPKHMATCGLFVLPSRTEGMGRVLIEAMASRKARLASRVDGIPYVITHDVDGFLFETENQQDLERKLVHLMSSDLLRSRLADAGWTRCRTEFSREKYLGFCKNFYSEIMSGLRVLLCVGIYDRQLLLTAGMYA